MELFAKSLQDPQVMKDFDFVCFPQRKYTDCGSCVYNEITSADWFYEAFNNSPATESGMLWIQPGCLFVGIGHFDDSSNTDCLMKSKLRASFPTNYTIFSCPILSYLILSYLIISCLNFTYTEQSFYSHSLMFSCPKLKSTDSNNYIFQNEKVNSSYCTSSYS